MQRLRPRISVMTGRQVGRVHDQSLHILATALETEWEALSADRQADLYAYYLSTADESYRQQLAQLRETRSQRSQLVDGLQEDIPRRFLGRGPVGKAQHNGLIHWGGSNFYDYLLLDFDGDDLFNDLWLGCGATGGDHGFEIICQFAAVRQHVGIVFAKAVLFHEAMALFSRQFR